MEKVAANAGISSIGNLLNQANGLKKTVKTPNAEQAERLAQRGIQVDISNGTEAQTSSTTTPTNRFGIFSQIDFGSVAVSGFIGGGFSFASMGSNNLIGAAFRDVTQDAFYGPARNVTVL